MKHKNGINMNYFKKVMKEPADNGAEDTICMTVNL